MEAPKGENQLPKVVQGVKFQNGIEVIKCRLTTPPDRSRHPISRIAPGTVMSTQKGKMGVPQWERAQQSAKARTGSGHRARIMTDDFF